MSAVVRISFGELLDKITILEIKRERVTDSDKVRNVANELEMLAAIWAPLEQQHPETVPLREALRAVNTALWDIEDAIRAKEAGGAFDGEFIDLARSVYRNNDQRAALKRRINDLLGSEIVEEKQYARY